MASDRDQEAADLDQLAAARIRAQARYPETKPRRSATARPTSEIWPQHG